MYLDNGRAWTTEAIINVTLDVEHDGSYRPWIIKDICSTAVLVQNRCLSVSFAKKSLHASTYRSKILGAEEY
jgi:hypothetical protein